MTTYYATDLEIGYEHFNEETVPGDNTIGTGRNTLLKDRAQEYVDNITESISDQVKKDIFLYAYGAYLEHTLPNPLIVEQMVGQSTGIPVAMSYKDTDVYGPGGSLY